MDTTGIEPVTPTMSTYFSLSTPSDLSDFAGQIRDGSERCAKRFGSLNLEHYPKRALRDFSNRHAVSDALRIFASTAPCGVRRRSRPSETAAARVAPKVEKSMVRVDGGAGFRAAGHRHVVREHATETRLAFAERCLGALYYNEVISANVTTTPGDTAPVCKSAYPGSIPGVASNNLALNH